MNWTRDQLNSYLAKGLARAGAPLQLPPGDPVEREADLHEQIRAECLTRGWLALHGSMACATARTVGEPDFVIFAEHPAMFLVECKRPGGKLSPAQAALHAWAAKLGWQVHTVHSFDEFLSVINPPKP